MKKLITSILAVIYFTFSAGVTIHMHYCMGEFIKFSFSETNKGVCGKCGMEKHDINKNCCTDVQFTAKISEAHMAYNHDFKFLLFYNDLIPSFYPAYHDRINPEVLYSGTPQLNSHGGEIPPYLYFRNLRI